MSATGSSVKGLRPFSTLVVEGPLAARMAKLQAAREGKTGLQIMTLPQVAARLAGGFIRPAQREELEPALRRSLSDGGFQQLGPLANLPGTVRALARTFERLWLAGVDLGQIDQTPRTKDLALLERRVRSSLGPGVLVPPDLAKAALDRAPLASTLLGVVEVSETDWVAPVWRALLAAIGGSMPCDVAASEARPPKVDAWLCADPHSEVVEALRWARALMARGEALPEEIAITTAAPATWDDAMQTLASSAGLPVHFSHGVPILSTVDGQACAALADLLGHGLSQDRVRRWLAHSGNRCPSLENLPERPLEGVRADAHLQHLNHWRGALDRAALQRTDGRRPGVVLGPALELLSQGWSVAEHAGQQMISPSAGRVWKAALRAGPAEALEFSLANLRVSDGTDPGNSIVWCPASHLAGAPRMLGLASGCWPRGLASDPLVPTHILELGSDASPTRPEADRRAFGRIFRSASTVSLSLARRSGRGGHQAPSPLIPPGAVIVRLARNRIPAHAYSLSDRYAARLTEARAHERFARAMGCWWARRVPDANAHDGLLQAGHPVVSEAIARPQSATSLRRLLRDPQGFVWRYALGWRATVGVSQQLDLDPRAYGDLVHLLLQHTVTSLEGGPGFGRASNDEIDAALQTARERIVEEWPLERPAPPSLLWRYTVESASDVALRALRLDPKFEVGTRSWTEAVFGSPEPPSAGSELPWNPSLPVPVPGTILTIRGSIDRLELDQGDRNARVTDYKTGAVPKVPQNVRLDRGRELQRVLYAIAVAHHLPDTRIQSRLVYLAEDSPRPYRLQGDDLAEAIHAASDHFNAAIALLGDGRCLPGPEDAWEPWNELRIALPAAAEPYVKIKDKSFRETFGDFANVWRAQ